MKRLTLLICMLASLCSCSYKSNAPDVHELSRQVAAHYAILLRDYGNCRRIAVYRQTIPDVVANACKANHLNADTCTKLALQQYDDFAMRMFHVNSDEYAKILGLVNVTGQQFVDDYNSIVDEQTTRLLSN